MSLRTLFSALFSCVFLWMGNVYSVQDDIKGDNYEIIPHELCDPFIAPNFLTLDWVSEEERNASNVRNNFVVYTIPKSGSHLLHSCLFLLTGRRKHFFPRHPTASKQVCEWKLRTVNRLNRYVMSHELYTSEQYNWWCELGCKIMFIIRDPRNVCLSGARWRQLGGANHPASFYPWFRSLTLNEQVRWVMKHVAGVGIDKQFRWRLPWMTCDDVLTIRFEDLIGPNRGGSTELQVAAVKDIAEHIGCCPTDEEISAIADQLYGHPSSPTFDSRSQYDWKSVFDEETTQLAKELIGDLLIELGYEQDYDW